MLFRSAGVPNDGDDDDDAAGRRSLPRRLGGQTTHATLLRRARTLRESIFRIFAAVAARRHSSPADLAVLNAELPRALGSLRILAAGAGFSWAAAVPGPERLLAAVARSAADLLTSRDAGAVRECAAPGCRWLFLDRSRNRSRRWCDMKVCGNRAKARRHYRRVRNAARRARRKTRGRKPRGRNI